MLKAAIKQSASSQIHNRVIPSTAIQSCAKKLEALRSEVGEVLNEEKEENMIEHEEEIFGRPKRVWFQTEKEKQKAKGEFRFCRDVENIRLIVIALCATEASKSAYVSAFPEVKEKSKSPADQVSLAKVDRRKP
jgi:hypothetical protein